MCWFPSRTNDERLKARKEGKPGGLTFENPIKFYFYKKKYVGKAEKRYQWFII